MSRTDNALRLLSDYMKQGARLYPEKPAFIVGDRKISFQEFADTTERLAKYLLKTGVQKGDRIAYILTPRPEFFYLYMAASRIGAIIVGMSTRFTSNEMKFILQNSEASYLVSLAGMYGIDYQAMLGEILPECPLIKNIVIVEGVPVLENARDFAEIIKDDYGQFDQELLDREAKVATDDGLYIVYTSGTTGKPKGALMSHKNIIHMCLVALGHLEIRPDDIWLNCMPVNHVSGGTDIGASAIIINSTQILTAFTPAGVLESIEKERVSVLEQVPTMFAMEFALPDYDKYDLSSLRIVIIAGSMASREIVVKMVSAMCSNCFNCYGLTEISGLITYTDKGSSIDTLSETVGKCPPEYEMKLVDKERKIVPQGTPGEVAFRGTCVIKEYYKLPEITADTIDSEGWLYTGDIGFVDADSNLRLIGRAKEMYITGGYNVYPAEIEDYIMRYPDVLLVAVIGIKHKIMGEVGRAYIVPKPGCVLDGEAIQEFLKDYVADYKIPRDYVFRETLPFTLLGKIEKKTLMEEAAAEEM